MFFQRGEEEEKNWNETRWKKKENRDFLLLTENSRVEAATGERNEQKYENENDRLKISKTISLKLLDRREESRTTPEETDNVLEEGADKIRGIEQEVNSGERAKDGRRRSRNL